MIELALLGVGADGLTLVFTDAEGERYSAPITDELRAATRRDRPRIESAPSPARRTADAVRPGMPNRRVSPSVARLTIRLSSPPQRW